MSSMSQADGKPPPPLPLASNRYTYQQHGPNPYLASSQQALSSVSATGGRQNKSKKKQPTTEDGSFIANVSITAGGTRLARGHFDLEYTSSWNYDQLYAAVESKLQAEYQVCLTHFYFEAKKDGTKAFALVKPDMVINDTIGLEAGNASFKIILKNKNQLKGGCDKCDIAGPVVADKPQTEENIKNDIQHRDMEFLQQAMMNFHGGRGSPHELVKQQFGTVNASLIEPQPAFNGSKAPKLSHFDINNKRNKNKNTRKGRKGGDMWVPGIERVDQARKQKNKQKIKEQRWGSGSSSSHNGGTSNNNVTKTNARGNGSNSGMNRLLSYQQQTGNQRLATFVKGLNDKQVTAVVKLLFGRGKVFPIINGIPSEYYDETANTMAAVWEQHDVVKGGIGDADNDGDDNDDDEYDGFNF